MRQDPHSITSGRRGSRHVAADAEVQDLLEQLCRCVTSGDGEGAASCWDTPAFVIGDEHEQTVQSQQELVAFFGAAREQYNRRGIEDTRADVEHLDWITPRIALVRVRWPWLDARERESGEETSTYLVKRDDDGRLKLRIAMMHGESGEAAGRPS